MNWFSHIPSAAWAGLLTPIIIALLFAAARSPVRRDANGWIRLRPSIGLLIMGVPMALAAILFTALPLLALVAENTSQMLIFLILGPPLSALMWYGVYGTFIARVRFNSDGIEYRGLLRTLFVRWDEVVRIKDNAALGSFISTSQGRLIAWKWLRGFQQLVDEAAKHGVEIDPNVRSAF